ncbi:MAG: aldehyde dehydrogenase family protein [Clostridiales bacterium]|nr:aldehyde dehydrogenase family protein [Clostridiales bacterium]
MMDTEQERQMYLEGVIIRARSALNQLESYTQEQVDLLCMACAGAVYRHAEELARDAVDETRMGCYEDKVAKNKGKARLIWHSLKGKRSVGILDRDETTGITRIAQPVGVIGAITPVTNPIVTCMSNAMFALKCRNAIILAPHPRAIRCCIKTVQYMNEALAAIGAPEHAIQILPVKSLELTRQLMQAVDVVVATGGMNMVKAVYASGKPALGVGAGNVQALVDTDVDLNEALPRIIEGRRFDNGIICTGEQAVHLPEAIWTEALSVLDANGAYVLTDRERPILRAYLFPDGVMNKDAVGQSASVIASACGMKIPENTKVLAVAAEDTADILGSEKMCPVLTLYAYRTWEQAVEQARNNLEMIGKGHSLVVHSRNRRHIEYAALNCQVSRIVCNQTCATSAGGSFYNGLNPTNTLGCGSWGNNSISENLTYYHLMNISRIADWMPDNPVPDDSLLWRL